MKQFITVLKFELGNYFKSKSFMVTTILLAVVMAAVVIVPPIFMNEDKKTSEIAVSEESGENAGEAEGTDEAEKEILALADPNHTIEDISVLTAMLPIYEWKLCEDDAAVRSAVENGEAEVRFRADR